MLWARWPLAGGYPVCYVMFDSISGLFPLDSAIPPLHPLNYDNPKCLQTFSKGSPVATIPLLTFETPHLPILTRTHLAWWNSRNNWFYFYLHPEDFMLSVNWKWVLAQNFWCTFKYRNIEANLGKQLESLSFQIIWITLSRNAFLLK